MVRSIKVPCYRIRNTAAKAIIGQILHKQPSYYEGVIRGGGRHEYMRVSRFLEVGGEAKYDNL